MSISLMDIAPESGIGMTKKPAVAYHLDGDEVLTYVGFDPDGPEYLGAECEFDLSKEYEKYVFRYV